MEKKEEKNIFKGKYYYANGKRKTAIAKVRLYPKGKGRIFVNDKELIEYFPSKDFQAILKEPLFDIAGYEKFDLSIKIIGGGIRGQVEAVRLGIAKALVDMDRDVKPVLKKKGLLTRDARKKERKKPGLKKARRAPQWAKR